MPRVRLSVTVDRTLHARAVELSDASGSRLVDLALAALVERLESEREIAALTARPYADDPELSWSAAPGPDLPYDGEVPDEVLALAAARRARHAS